MITLELNVNKKINKIKIKDEVLFNALLSQNTELIKKLIKSINPFYKVSETFFEVVNTYVDFKEDGVSLYAGLVVRTSLTKYAVLYLEGTVIDEDYLVKLIDQYIHDVGDHSPEEINVDTFEIKKKIFLNLTKNI